MCEHETVLAIYEGEPHTEKNISHFRCISCGETSIKRFGEKIIYDNEDKGVKKNE